MDILYEDISYRVTPTTLEKGATTFPIRSIASVSSPIQQPFEFFGGFLLNGALLLFGLWATAQLTTGWIVGGLIATAIGGFNVWGQFHRGYAVIIKFSDGQEIFVNMNDKNAIQNFYHAVRQALDNQ